VPDRKIAGILPFIQADGGETFSAFGFIVAEFGNKRRCGSLAE
jgi:hypothetical protein